MSKTENSSRFQKKIRRLTQRRLLLALRTQRLRNVLFWLFALLFLIGALIMDIVSWYTGFYKSLSLLIMCIIFIPMMCIILIDEMMKPVGHKQRILEKYGNADMLLERLQEGATHILLETKTVVITESYIIDQRSFETYIPFGKLAAFEIDDGILHKLLFGSSDVYLNTMDEAGERFNCVIRKEDLHNKGKIVTLLKQCAPHAKYGMPMPDKKDSRKKE